MKMHHVLKDINLILDWLKDEGAIYIVVLTWVEEQVSLLDQLI